jgi:putative hydrolase
MASLRIPQRYRKVKLVNNEFEQDDELKAFIGSIVGPDAAEDVLRQMQDRGLDIRAMLGEGGKLPDPAAVQAAMSQVRQVMQSGGDNPVNEVIAHDVARQTAVQGGDPSITGAQSETVRNAFRNAELWLDVATDFVPARIAPKAWSRAEWVEETLPTWNKLIAPVAAALSEATAQLFGDRGDESSTDDAEFSGGLPAEALARLGFAGMTPKQILKRLGSTSFGMQVGHAAGKLSREVFGTMDLGIPLVASGQTALLPENVSAYAKDLEIPEEEVRAYLAVREAAVARLFASVSWLRPHLEALIERYARQTEINHDQLEEQMRGVDPTSQQQLASAMTGGIFASRSTPEQKATLLELETVLALIEGWVDEVTTAATIIHLPSTMALREMLRRRRGAGGPAEQAFASLVGLELRPRRSRDAAKLFTHVYTAGGIEARDGVWAHPEQLPTSADLDDPSGYLARQLAAAENESDLDIALAKILAEG